MEVNNRLALMAATMTMLTAIHLMSNPNTLNPLHSRIGTVSPQGAVAPLPFRVYISIMY